MKLKIWIRRGLPDEGSLCQLLDVAPDVCRSGDAGRQHRARAAVRPLHGQGALRRCCTPHPQTGHPTRIATRQVEDDCNVDDPPEYSLANGLDFGVLSRVPLLADCPLTQLETVLLSHIRLYHLTIKVVSHKLRRTPDVHAAVLHCAVSRVPSSFGR